MGLFRTGTVAGRAFIREFGWREGGKRILYGIREALKASSYSETPQSKDRMSSCERCQMYSKEFASCGEPTEFYLDADDNRKSLGCHCYLPLAVKAPSHDCWARFHGFPWGWPEKLRPLIKE